MKNNKNKMWVAPALLAMVLGLSIPHSTNAMSTSTMITKHSMPVMTASSTKTSMASNATSSMPSISTNDSISSLQSFLIAKGFLTLPVGTAMGHFGPLTRKALAQYQASVNINPANGYFGPITKAKIKSDMDISVKPTGTVTKQHSTVQATSTKK
jgi:peptidoglycan hydrolase-like protein with peptidoglycan-binding domain